jgi:hypothetical protein
MVNNLAHLNEEELIVVWKRRVKRYHSALLDHNTMWPDEDLNFLLESITRVEDEMNRRGFNVPSNSEKVD